MKRRDISKLLFAGAAGSTLTPQAAQAQTCAAPCYAATTAEIAAGITPVDTSYPFGHVLRYGMVAGIGIASDLNTPIFNSMMSVAAQNKGMDVFFPVGDWRGNFLVNTDNVTIFGSGGVGESNQSCLRPYSSGGGTVTLRFGNMTRMNEKCGIRHLHVSGNTGTGAMADVALALEGGISHFSGHDFEVVDGLRSLHIEGGGGLPVTCCNFSQWHIRNAGSSNGSRAIYLRRPADPDYVTAIYFSQGHVNGPTGGYWLEANGTGGPGISVQLHQVYVDSKPGHGVLLVGGSSSISSNDVHLDPGAQNAQIIERTDTSYSPGNSLLGTMHHGGQQIRYSNATLTNIPTECDTFAKKAWIGELFLNMPLHFTNTVTAGSPFDETNTLPVLNSDTANGPITISRASFSLKTAGAGFRVAEGTNAKQGVVTLVAGTRTIANTSVTANSRIFLTSQSDGGTVGFLRVSARSAGASFTIRSSSSTDTSTVAYEIFEPA